ncbi:S9 family peptidase [Ahrensia sp. R2A130]|uniref:S9 family peptidase n=1 Tax=Ahrensia sp. R2A130 TaxID=744979 RepID=UPI0001E0E0C7|nr:S9 family peptidase [Ahrensia sp. R2A130]EFL88927.1 protease 2 [Ahrensia sp. R2A130]
MAFDLSALTPPSAEKRATTRTYHGQDLYDDYAWLRADNWQEVMRDPAALPQDIRDYLEAENTYQEAAFEDTQQLRDELFDEMKARIKPDESSVPSPHGKWSYASRYEEGAEYPLFTREPRDGGEETVLFNGPKEAKDHEYFALGMMSHSPDHERLAWSVDTNGSEYHHMRIRDLASGEDSAELVRDVGSFAWCADARSYLYVKVDENHRPNKVFYRPHDGEEQLIYNEEDARFYVGLDRSLDGRWIAIGTGQNDEDEVRLLRADDPTAEPILLAPRRAGHEYSVDTHGDQLFITTNSGGSENFRIMTASIDAPHESDWKELVPHRSDVLLDGSFVLKNWMVRQERENALPRIVIRHLESGEEHTVSFDEEAYSLGIRSGYEFETDILRFSYSSPSTPAQVWDYNMATRERVLRKEQEIPSGHNPSDYVVRRLHAPSSYGVMVPLTVLHRKDMSLDGSSPCLLYGYGSYGAGMPASFSTNRLSLVDRGFVYCTAHIRGGDELGRNWYEQTKKAGKPRTFQDFIAAGEHLAAEGFTSKGQVVAMGGSAGGLLMGAVTNMAPDLFSGIIAQVPFVDVLNTMLDDTLPLTPGEWSQWGNPIESAEEFAIIQGYSPYDNVVEQAYPPIFALSGLTDPRVQYWEPSKWIAKLREKSGNANTILLKTNMGSGHFGKTGRFAYLEEVALVYAFALKCAGKA